MRAGKGAFVIEWHRITPETYTAMYAIWPSLQNIFVEAFLPVVKAQVYAHDPRIASVPEEERSQAEQNVVDEITQSLNVEWNTKLQRFHAEVSEQTFPASYLILAKNRQREIIGFAFLKEESLQTLLKTRLLNATEGSLENGILLPDADDEMSIELVAVKPDIQNKGIGKALLFAVFDHRPHIKKIYLTTSASQSNAKTQGFYEHVGFTRVFKGIFSGDESESGFRQEKIVYLYQRP